MRSIWNVDCFTVSNNIPGIVIKKPCLIASMRFYSIKTKTSNMSQTFIGKPAPDFKGTAVVNGEFKEISLADYKGKYLVVFFYPLDL